MCCLESKIIGGDPSVLIIVFRVKKYGYNSSRTNHRVLQRASSSLREAIHIADMLQVGKKMCIRVVEPSVPKLIFKVIRESLRVVDRFNNDDFAIKVKLDAILRVQLV